MSDFDAILCDVWGVVHDGFRCIRGVADALLGARLAGLPVVLVSNVPRTAATVPHALRRLGLPSRRPTTRS